MLENEKEEFSPKLRLEIVFLFNIPAQVEPSPENPASQVQVKLPTVLEHDALEG